MVAANLYSRPRSKKKKRSRSDRRNRSNDKTSGFSSDVKTSSFMNEMTCFMADTNRTLFFSDVPDGALKTKPTTQRKEASSFSEALANLGADLENSLFFNDLASCTDKINCGRMSDVVVESEEEYKQESRCEGGDNPVEERPVDDTKSVASRDESREDGIRQLSRYVGEVSEVVEEMDGVVQKHTREAGGADREQAQLDYENDLTRDEVLDGTTDLIESAVDFASCFVYEVADTVRFTKDEIADSDIGQGLVAGVRYVKNVAGVENSEFSHKNAQMRAALKEKMRKGYVPASQCFKDKRGKSISMPCPPVEESKIEAACRSLTMGPPTFARLERIEERKRAAEKEKEAASLAAAEKKKQLYAKSEAIRAKMMNAVADEMKDYDEMVTTGPPARRSRRYRRRFF